jgi:hypothetical protein
MRDPAHVQGPKKFACQNEALIPFWPAGEHPLTAALDKFMGPYKILWSLVRVTLRWPGDIVFKAFCPADFGGANFSVPWATRKAVFGMHWDFFTGSGGERKGEGIGFRASISQIDGRVIGWTIRAKII